MHPFNYTLPANKEQAIKAVAGKGDSTFIAGGTTLVDLMKLGVMTPGTLVDINELGMNKVEKRGDSVFIGALSINSDVAFNKTITHDFPVLSQALLSGASPQLRNMATVGGNIMQRTRCYYFRDPAYACNKKAPGSGCPAAEGQNRIHAILGGSEQCVATHGSDMCVALVALDAIVHVLGPKGSRKIPMADFHVLPGNHPEIETVLEPGELILEIELPAREFARRSHYLKVRDRASYAFALSSVAAALHVQGGVIESARLALGGVATKPWRCYDAEKVLVGKRPDEQAFKLAAQAALSGAKPLKHNGFKIELTKRTIVRALKTVGELS